ncbi:MAG: phosphatidylglycerophosphatase A [Kiloniellales bacterium]
MRPARRNTAWLIATWFGVGLIPVAPGTAASATALPVAWVIVTATGPLGLALATVLAFAVGGWAAGACGATEVERDPPQVVADEVAGQWLALLPAAMLSQPAFWHYALAFALFRAADIAKPWPAGWIDRNLPGAPGIMLDDLVAGLYAALGLGVLVCLAGGC